MSISDLAFLLITIAAGFGIPGLVVFAMIATVLFALYKTIMRE